MTDEQWQSAWNLYQTSKSIPREDLDSFLKAAAGDPEVRDEILSLLAGESKGDPLDRAGLRLGRYVLTGKLGEGGMGEVYAARDSELGRMAAVKLLAPSAGNSAARFIQEAKAASSLNHPNIITIYEVVHAGSRDAIVMELVDGVPLRQLCASTVPIDRLLHIGGQIARALAAAHARGIVHCDLKPENLMIRPDGIVKVLDFGLALDLSAVHSQTVLPAGTLRYMSPEQSRGEGCSAASDVFSFGIVLYELATGVHPFERGSIFETLKALNEIDAAPASSHNAFLPASFDELILAMLARDPVQRPAASEVAQAIESRFTLQPARAPFEKAKPAAAHSAPGRRFPAWIAVAAAVLGLLGLAALYFRYARSPAPEMRVEMVVPATDDSGSFALSPDGRRVAFAATTNGSRRLWVRALDSGAVEVLPGSEDGSSPFWSPDSKSLGFFADFKLKRIDLDGGEPKVLATVPSSFAQGTWGAKGVILFSWGITPVSRVPASGGTATAAVKLERGQSNQFSPRFLPDGRRFLYVVNGVDPGIWLADLDGAPPRRITGISVGTDSAAEYVAPGWLVRVRQGVLEAQRFDAERAQLIGDPMPLAHSVAVDTGNLSGSFSVSASGAIAWRGGAGGRRQLVWFNRLGQNLGPLGDAGDSTLYSPELSPDGTRVATMRGPVGSSDIWMQQGMRNSRITLDRADDRYPIWSPDGKQIVFASNRNRTYDLYTLPADGSADDRLLWQSPQLKRPNSWSPDGKFILYCAQQNNGDLMLLPLTGDRKPFPFLATPFDEQQGVFSPDGKWIAYQSDETGQYEVYVRPMSGTTGAVQVSAGGGHSPRWRADGRELYYLSPDLKLMAAKVTVQGAAFTALAPETLFQTQVNQATNRQQYDVARDGRFLILTDLPDTSAEPIHLLLNWLR